MISADWATTSPAAFGLLRHVRRQRLAHQALKSLSGHRSSLALDQAPAPERQQVHLLGVSSPAGLLGIAA